MGAAMMVPSQCHWARILVLAILNARHSQQTEREHQGHHADVVEEKDEEHLEEDVIPKRDHRHFSRGE